LNLSIAWLLSLTFTFRPFSVINWLVFNMHLRPKKKYVLCENTRGSQEPV
jgi:hypothetical protein